MMIHYHDAVNLKTKKIVFENVYIARDSGTLEQLKELSSKRKVIEDSINKSSSITEVIAREMSGGLTSQYEQDIQKLEQYLPLLANLMHHVDSAGDFRQMLDWVSNLKIRWTSALTSTPFFILTSPKYIQINSLHFELGMILFVYGANLQERALEILPTDMVQSATLFRKAAGVYHYLSQEVLPPLQSVMPTDRSPESDPSISYIMSLICLAEAQAVAARRAEKNGSSFAFLSKLHYGVSEFLGEATNAFYSAAVACKDISSRFLDFVSCAKGLHELRSRRYLSQGLSSINGHVGLSIGILRYALTVIKNKLPTDESWRLVFKEEIESVNELLKKFERENDFVWREKIPAADELPLLEGTKIVGFIPYEPQKWHRELAFKKSIV